MENYIRIPENASHEPPSALGFDLSRRLFGAVRPYHVIVGAEVPELGRYTQPKCQSGLAHSKTWRSSHQFLPMNLR